MRDFLFASFDNEILQRKGSTLKKRFLSLRNFVCCFDFPLRVDLHLERSQNYTVELQWLEH